MAQDQSASRNSASKSIEVTGDQFAMGKLSSDNEQDLPGMLAVAKATAEKVWPHTTDAQVWATEFKKRFPDVDEGTMIGWFANAIMAGHDAATFARSERREPTPIGIFWQTVADGKWHFNEGVFCKDDVHDNGRPIRIAYVGEEAPQSNERGS